MEDYTHEVEVIDLPCQGLTQELFLVNYIQLERMFKECDENSSVYLYLKDRFNLYKRTLNYLASLDISDTKFVTEDQYKIIMKGQIK
jgi:hypothetical protein